MTLRRLPTEAERQFLALMVAGDGTATVAELRQAFPDWPYYWSMRNENWIRWQEFGDGFEITPLGRMAAKSPETAERPPPPPKSAGQKMVDAMNRSARERLLEVVSE